MAWFCTDQVVISDGEEKMTIRCEKIEHDVGDHVATTMGTSDLQVTITWSDSQSGRQP